MINLKCFLSAALAVALSASSVSYADSFPKNIAIERDKDVVGYKIDLTSSLYPAGVYTIGKAFPGAVLDFEFGASISAILYACDTQDGAGDNDLSNDDECVALATLAAADSTVDPLEAKKLWYVLDINTAGSGTLTIKGSWDQVSGGSEGYNQTSDRDGDGNVDYVLVRGDYNGDGVTDLEDIDAAVEALTDTGPKVVEVVGVFDSSWMTASAELDWDASTFIELGANTTLQCQPDARLYGPSLDFWRSRSTATRLVANEEGADNVVVRGCMIENTDLIDPFDANTGGTGWGATPLFGGIHFGGCDGCLAEGNVVRGSPHSGFFMTRNNGSTFRGNTAYATGESFNHEGDSAVLVNAESLGSTAIEIVNGGVPSNCAANDWILIELDEADPQRKNGSTRKVWAAGWIEDIDLSGDPDIINIRRSGLASGRNPGLPGAASSGNRIFCSEGDKHAFESYTEDDAADENGNDIVAKNNVFEFNRAELISNVAFQIRGVNMDENECENESAVTCWHENMLIRNNRASDVNNELVQVRGSRGAVVEHNIGERTGGVTFTFAAQTCSAPYDDSLTASTDQRECSTSTILRGNTIRDCRPNSGSNAVLGGCVRFNNGHERISWFGDNIIDSNIQGTAYAIAGDVKASEIHMAAKNIYGPCLTDGLNASGASPLTSPLYGSASFENCGLGFAAGTASNAPAISWRDDHTASLVLDPFKVSGVVASVFFSDPVSAYDITSPIFQNVYINGQWAGYSGTFATLSALDLAVQCTPEYEGLTAIIQDAASASDCTTGGGGTENWCRCNGSDFVNVDPITNRDVFMWLFGSGETASGGGVYGGRVENALATGSSLFNLSSGAGTNDGFVISGVTLAKADEGMLTSDAPLGMQEQAGTVTNLTIQGISFDGITDANRYDGFESTDFSSDSMVVDISGATAGGSCNTGTIQVDKDNTAAGQTLYVCENSVWIDLD